VRSAGFGHCASCYYICHIPCNINSVQIRKAHIVGKLYEGPNNTLCFKIKIERDGIQRALNPGCQSNSMKVVVR